MARKSFFLEETHHHPPYPPHPPKKKKILVTSKFQRAPIFLAEHETAREPF